VCLETDSQRDFTDVLRFGNMADQESKLVMALAMILSRRSRRLPCRVWPNRTFQGIDWFCETIPGFLAILRNVNIQGLNRDAHTSDHLGDARNRRISCNDKCVLTS
jgi:hypothetical protein